MAKAAAKAKKQRTRTGLLTKVLILALLVGMGWQLHRLRDQVADAQESRDVLAGEVAAQQQENDALAKDIAEGATSEKMQEIAREQLGMVEPRERVFCDVSN